MSNNFFSAIKKIPGLNKATEEKDNIFPNKNKEYSTEIYSEKINAKYRTIFLDLKEGVKGKFIKISEKNKQGQRNTVMIDKIDLDTFIEALQRLSSHLKNIESSNQNDDNIGNYDQNYTPTYSSEEKADDELELARNVIQEQKENSVDNNYQLREEKNSDLEVEINSQSKSTSPNESQEKFNSSTTENKIDDQNNEEAEDNKFNV